MLNRINVNELVDKDIYTYCESKLVSIDLLLKELHDFNLKLDAIRQTKILSKEISLHGLKDLAKKARESLQMNMPVFERLQRDFADNKRSIRNYEILFRAESDELVNIDKKLVNLDDTKKRYENSIAYIYSSDNLSSYGAGFETISEVIQHLRNETFSREKRLRDIYQDIIIDVDTCSDINKSLLILNNAIEEEVSIFRSNRKIIDELFHLAQIASNEDHPLFSFVTGKESQSLVDISKDEAKFEKFNLPDDYSGHTPLYYAVRCGVVDLTIYLIATTSISDSNLVSLKAQATAFYKLTGEESYKKISELLDPKIVESYPSYQKLWDKPRILTDKIAAIFEDYVSPSIIAHHLPNWLARILTLHWNRSNVALAAQMNSFFKAVPQMRRDDKEYLISMLQDHLNTVFHLGGSFQRRLDFIGDILGVKIYKESEMTSINTRNKDESIELGWVSLFNRSRGKNDTIDTSVVSTLQHAGNINKK